MKLTVYIDILIIVNIILNYMLLRITGIITGASSTAVKLIVSSVAGALFSFVIFIDMPYLISVSLKIIRIALAVYIAFGFISLYSYVKNVSALLAANLILSGAVLLLSRHTNLIYINNCVYYFNISPVLLVGCITIIYISISIRELFYIDKKQIYSLDVYIFEKKHTVTAFYDTGFRLKDIISHNTVIMCSVDYFTVIADSLLSSEVKNFFMAGKYSDNRIIPVFYSDISDKGMLPAVKTDKVCININDKNLEFKNIILAVCRQPLQPEYQIIFGKDFLDRTGN